MRCVKSAAPVQNVTKNYAPVAGPSVTCAAKVARIAALAKDAPTYYARYAGTPASDAPVVSAKTVISAAIVFRAYVRTAATIAAIARAAAKTAGNAINANRHVVNVDITAAIVRIFVVFARLASAAAQTFARNVKIHAAVAALFAVSATYALIAATAPGPARAAERWGKYAKGAGSTATTARASAHGLNASAAAASKMAALGNVVLAVTARPMPNCAGNAWTPATVAI